MNDCFEEFNNQKYFYDWVLKELLIKLPDAERILLAPNIYEDLYKKALEIGYDKKQSEIIRKRFSNYYLHPNFSPIKVETPETNYCRTALAQIIQERISNSEVFQEDIPILDQLLLQYDPKTPDEYLAPISENIQIPEFKPELWIENICCTCPKNLNSFDWITLYSSTEFNLKDVDEEGRETERIAALFVSTEDAKWIEKDFHELKIDDIICNVSSNKTITEFKNLSSFSNHDKFYTPSIIVNHNTWRLHSPNTLVRLDQSFLDQNGLTWDENSILNLISNNSTIVRYNLWAGPFDGERYSRKRIATGVKLEIKKSFLKRYLKNRNMSMLVITEKKRWLGKSDLNATTTTKQNKIQKNVYYSDTLMIRN